MWISKGVSFVPTNFNMQLKASGTLTDNVRLQYLHNLLCGKVLHKLYTLCLKIGSTTATHLNQVVLG